MRRFTGTISPWFAQNDTMVTDDVVQQWARNVIGVSMVDNDDKVRGKVVEAKVVEGQIVFVGEVDDMVAIDEVPLRFFVGTDISLAKGGMPPEAKILEQGTDFVPD